MAHRPEQALALLPRIDLMGGPSRVERWPRLEAALDRAPGSLLAKRDDAVPFAFGGNKVRKLEFVMARAIAEGADTLITCGGTQSNHCRATAAAAVRQGLSCHLVLSGDQPETLRANTKLDHLLGATLHFVEKREDRAPAMEELGLRLRREGRKPALVPLGASTPLGAAAFAWGFLELLEQIDAPDVIIHSSSSGGTQAGLIAGVALHGLQDRVRIVGVSADEPAQALRDRVSGLARGVLDLAQSDAPLPEFEVDDSFVGAGYGAPTDASRDAMSRLARAEAVFVDHTYTAKALAALIARTRDGDLKSDSRVLFWHTGGQVGLFA